MKKIVLGIMALACIKDCIGQQKKTVVLDYFFNHETKKTPSGETIRWHYLWEDTAQSGYSKLGGIFQKNGFATTGLEQAPDKKNLENASIYIIVDPDTEKESMPNKPNYILPEHIKAIAKWVKKGGVLVMFANDSTNVELQHFNKLTETFGIHLDCNKKSLVEKDNYEMAAFYIPALDTIFNNANKVYLKEVTSLTLSGTARPILKHHKEGYTVAACNNYGKGMVVVIGDPWFYNEYLNGLLGYKKGWQNELAADLFVKWLAKYAK